MKPILTLVCLVLSSITVNAQSHSIKVLSKETEKPILGAHISTYTKKEEGSKIKLIAITNEQGLSILNSSDLVNAQELLISYVSFKSKIINKKTLKEGRINSFILDQNVRTLETVEVVFSERPIDTDLVLVPATTIKINKQKRTVPAFETQPHEVTVRQFKEFIEATDYVTEVEEKSLVVAILRLQSTTDKYLKRFENIKHETFKEAKRKRFQGWERKFELIDKNNINWRHDELGNLRGEDELDFPVINITWNDAMAYATWLDMRLPTHEEYVAMATGSKPMGWNRSNSTGVLKDVFSSPRNRKGLLNLYGNAGEILADEIEIDGVVYVKVTALNSFGSKFTEPIESYLIDKKKLVTNLFKFGFRCVRSIDQ
ncbi:SUMF1/EgtB/PvdO family nonheme iron enzyme [Roseivirga sp.]|uniref:SUMF1/EgtB/PvdO family nonheme iron enzyme n=1 Tax=Roseivirga sp. TaxID=1964215 RepID=UPI003B8ADA77